jgi:hypothetical protein
MTAPANASKAQYHYTENGVTQGPYTAQQLKGLADAGKIQPQTLIWKEGLPQWVPASSLKGLFASAVSAQPLPRTAGGPPPLQPNPVPLPDLQAPAAAGPRTGLLLGIIGGGVLLVGLVVLAIILMSGGKDDKKTTKDGKDGDGKTTAADKDKKNSDKTTQRDQGQKPKDKDQVANKDKEKPPPPPPPEFNAPDLLRKYASDSAGTMRELGGKTITLKVEGTWRVDQLEQCIDKTDGNLKIRYFQGLNAQMAGPSNAIFLFFPVADAKAKLGFFAKIKEYAEKRKKGDHVVMSITGTLTTYLYSENKLTYMLVKDATLN